MDAQLRVHARNGRDRRRRRLATVEPRGDTVVRELGAIHHRRAVDLGFAHAAVRGDGHRDDDREALTLRGERREIGRELFGQHRKDPARRVDRRRVRLRVAVDGRVARDERVDVRDGDEDPHRAARERLRDRELIEVTRVVVVDRRPQEAAEVANRAAGARRRRGDGGRLGEDGGREVREESALEHRASRDGTEEVAARGRGGIHEAQTRTDASGAMPWSQQTRI